MQQPQQFDALVLAVKNMRTAQKRYFAMRGKLGNDMRLQIAKDAEKEVDALLVQIEKPAPAQTLFD